MDKMSLFDWQIMQTRKEVEEVHKAIGKSDAVDLAIIVELILIIISFVLDHIIIDSDTTSTITTIISSVWLKIAIVLVAVVVGVWAIQAIIITKKNRQAARITGARDVVDLIDNKLCYYLMTAQTMLEFGAGIDTNIDKFYLIEASYYINKCIMILLSVENNISNSMVEGLSHDDYLDFRLNKARIANIFDLLEEQYSILQDQRMKKGENISDQVLERTFNENEYFRGELKRIRKEVKKALVNKE